MMREPDQNAAASENGDVGPDSSKLIYSVGVCFVAAVGGFLFGYDLNMIGSVNLYLGDYFGIPKDSLTFGLLSASAVMGCIPGPLLGIWLCDAMGRKRTIMVASALLGVSALFTALAWDIWSFNILWLTAIDTKWYNP